MLGDLSDSISGAFLGGALFDDITDTTYFVKDLAGRYFFVNDALVSRCGMQDKGDLLGKTTAELFPNPLGDEFLAQDREILAGGPAILSQLELHVHADGSQGWCLTWKRALRNEKGEIMGLSGISRDVVGATPSARDLDSLADVLSYIRNHLDTPLRVTDLEKATGLSSYQISQRIEGLFGISTKQYMSRCRIDAACHALEHSDESLSEIALACGFSDQSAFTRQFGRIVGMTPKSYRKQRG